MLTVGSLFAGIGGFDLAFGRAGFRTAWAVEIDHDARRVLAARFPGAELREDVRACGRRDLPPVDVLCGGFPCQDLSVAGKRGGLMGERSGLFYEMVRITDELQPHLLCWENVPGLLSSDSGRDFARVLRALADIGYFGAWRVLDARFFGVPQRRRRVFGVFARGRAGALRAAQILALGEGGGGHPAASREAGPGVTPGVTPGARRAGGNRAGEQLVAGALQAHSKRHGHAMGTQQAAEEGHIIPIDMRQASRGETMTNNRSEGAASGGPPGTGVGEAGDPCPSLANTHTPAVAFQCHGSNVGPMGTVRSGNGHTTGGVPFLAHTLRPAGCDASEDGTGRGTPLVTAYVTPRICRNSESCNEVGIKAGEVVDSLSTDGPGAVAFSHTQGLDAQPSASAWPTLRGEGGGQAVGLGMTVRRLTPVECCRLQAFPDDWLSLEPPMNDSAQYRLLGNAVCVAPVEWLGRRICNCWGDGA